MVTGFLAVMSEGWLHSYYESFIGESTGKDTGEDTGKDTGKDTGEDTGKDTGKDTGLKIKLRQIWFSAKINSAKCACGICRVVQQTHKCDCLFLHIAFE